MMLQKKMKKKRSEKAVMSNREIARWLGDYAELLEKGGEKLYRTKAYRRAAESVLFSLRPVEIIVSEEGRKGLQRRLPGVGAHLAVTIERLVSTGQFRSFEEWKRSSCLPFRGHKSVRSQYGCSEVKAPDRLAQNN
jgi:DNA polymerase/3'-5' exonuclease PolX